MNNKRVVRFVIILAALLTTWAIIEAYLIPAHGWINNTLTESEAFLGSITLRSFNYQSSIEQRNVYSLILIDNAPFIKIANSCNALVLFVIYSSFILAFPGAAKTKLLFLAIGNVSIYFINIIRIVALIFVKMYAPEYLDFNHHFTFQITVYACIFLYWRWFIKKNWHFLNHA